MDREYYGMKRCRFCWHWEAGYANVLQLCRQDWDIYRESQPMGSCQAFWSGGVLPEIATELELIRGQGWRYKTA